MVPAIVDTIPMAVLIDNHGDLGYRPKAGSVFHYETGDSAVNNEAGYRGPLVSSQSENLRVVLVGGSTTYGWGVDDDQTIDAHLRELLEDSLGVDVDVVNLGFDGYDSYQAFERLRSEGLSLNSHVVVVNLGINDVRNARYDDRLETGDPRTVIWYSVVLRLKAEDAAGGPSLWTRAKHYSFLLRFPGYLKNLLSGGGSADEIGPVEVHDDAVGFFVDNLVRIDSMLNANSQPLLVFATPPSALDEGYAADSMEAISYWLNGAAQTQQYRNRLAAAMDSVAEQLSLNGTPVPYVRPTVARETFLDDTHLSGEGNRQVAVQWSRIILPHLRELQDNSEESPDNDR